MALPPLFHAVTAAFSGETAARSLALAAH